ncbi:sigma-70 family RNA polymerase sigma factor [Tundrisphaera lichenicola]|uniref:sigma-70 family RNA polymerase sigma factor n=1 Tax=Tundrisphaera lichenicola TaxID=2029860 RepID=UPI003EBFDEBC
MTSGSRASAMRQIGTLFGSGTVAGMSDGQLLERFVSRRDEASEIAFAALVARHGPMVLGVCRRALPDRSDVDDAFQATFLILVRKARSVRVDDSLGRWLYGVSRKVAARVRAEAARRPRHDSGPLGSIEARPSDPDRFDLRATIDEELDRLPESYRSAIVLCDLGGFSIEEAAEDLGCPVGTIKSRLSRGRARLRTGLERRGLAPSSALVVPAVPSRLLEAATRASILSKVGGASAVGLVPASAALLAEGMLQTMTGCKIKLAASALMTIGLAVTGAGVMARQGPVDEKSVSGDTSNENVSKSAVVKPGSNFTTSEQMEIKLLAPVTVDFKETPLEEAIQFLQDYTGLKVDLDPKALAAKGLTRKVPVSLSAEEIMLKNALRQILKPLGLTYRVADESNSIKIGLNLTASERMEAKLLEPVTVDFNEAPLEEAIQFLQDYTGLNIVLDPKALAIKGLTPKSPVSLSAKGITLKSALKYLLQPLGLSYQIEQDLILITATRLSIQIDKLEQLRGQLARAQKLGLDPADPGILLAKREVDSRIEEIRSTILGKVFDPTQAKPVDRVPKPVPDVADAKAISPPREFNKVSMPDYVVEPPDIIVIEVLQAREGRPITGERLVKPDGKISLGFYGELYVAGLTTTEIKEKIVQHLRDYLSDELLGLVSVDPATGETKKTSPRDTDRVFVDVSAFNSKVYYVQGDVASPGRLPVTGNETVLDAINYAGGLQSSADKNNIRLIRPGKTGQEGEQILSVDFDAIIHKGDSKTNYQLFPGDRLIVYRDPTAKANPDVEARLSKVEEKLDEVLKVLERLPKAEAPPE